MHELSIAQNIVEIVEKYAFEANAKLVSLVEVDVGMISGIIPETLEFVWESAIIDTILKESNLKINIITAQAICIDCNNEFQLEDIYSVCPNCNSNKITIIKGKELDVKSIKIEC